MESVPYWDLPAPRMWVVVEGTMTAAVQAALHGHSCPRQRSGYNSNAEDIAALQVAPKSRTRKWKKAIRADG